LGLHITCALAICNLSKSSYYYQEKDGKPGRKPSTHTLKKTGEVIDNNQVIQYVEELFDDPFIDYGYLKTTHELRESYELIINPKKLYRLMKEASLLRKRAVKKATVCHRVSEWKVRVTHPFELIEIDIKYIYVAGEKRHYYMLNVLDCYSWKLLGYRFDGSIKKEDVIALLRSIFALYNFPVKITIRSDNGSQFIANKVAEYLDGIDVRHEFTHVATPQENGHVECFHSIVARFLRQRGDFKDFDEAKSVLIRWTEYYNERRRHKGCRYSTPNKIMQEYLDKQRQNIGKNTA
jgi:transposase InsO family protein